MAVSDLLPASTAEKTLQALLRIEALLMVIADNTELKAVSVAPAPNTSTSKRKNK